MVSKIFIITGTSGAGKDSVIEKLKEKGVDFTWAITTTCRKPRKGETQGNPYFFTDKDAFEKKIENGEMVEYAKVYDIYYGMEKKNIEESLKKKRPVIVRVDIQGVPIYKQKFPDSVCIFISAPSFETLEKRIRGRGKDSEEIIRKRMETAKEEMQDANTNPLYDYVIVNEENRLDETVEKVIEIIKESFKKQQNVGCT